MDPQHLLSLANQLLAGMITPEEFARRAANRTELVAGAQPFISATLPSATVDLDRQRRCGFPEVVFGPGKTGDQLRQIVTSLLHHGQAVLATRIDATQAAGLLDAFPTGRYNAVARTFRLGNPNSESAGQRSQNLRPFVAVISAGTGDLPVAEEVRETLDWMGVSTAMIQDVGVAGPHRLPQRLDEFQHADAVVVVAGMEGALPSVVGGYVACPVIAVPTSIGYGANFGGVSALLSMLNSCASNVAVVNIDAGFKGGYLAGLIATRAHPSIQSNAR
jgi:NCAIR mutase (PurE)-related protein